MNFDIRHRALQKMFCDVIAQAFEPHPNQFALRGGTKAALERVREALLAEGSFVCEIDIRDCYPSISTAQFHKTFKLKKEIIETVTTTSDLALILGKKMFPLTEGEVPNPVLDGIVLEFHLNAVRLGIPQGSSVSPLVLESITKPILEAIPGEAVVVNYADNFLVIGGTKVEVHETVEALRACLRASLAGRFHVGPYQIENAKDGFDFLGNHIRLYGGKVQFKPTDRNIQKFESRFSRDRAYIENPNIPENRRRKRSEALKRYVRRWPGCYPLWDGAKDFSKKHSLIADMASANLFQSTKAGAKAAKQVSAS